MAESTAFPKPREANDVGYQRISGFAVAGLVVGTLFVLFLLIQVVVGLLSHSTVLLPLWLEFFAALGVCLSLIGMRTIRNSDGTLAGLKIAKVGLWLSLVSGLGYGSYYGATYLAVRQQADAYVQSWFDTLRKGKINQAFLMTKPAEVARTANPDDERTMQTRFNALPASAPRGGVKAGELDLFRNNEIIYMLKQGGDATKVTSLGVRSWEHREGTYMVKRVYGVETPEGSFLVQISAVGKDGADAADKGRSWYVPFLETAVDKDSLKKSKLGTHLDQMRFSGAEFLNKWGKMLLAGQVEAAYLKTLEPKDDLVLSSRVFLRSLTNALGALMNLDRGSVVNAIASCTPTDRGTLRKVEMPGFELAFNKAGLLDFSKMTGDDKAARDAAEEALRNMLAHQGSPNAVIAAVVAKASCTRKLWSVDADKRVLFPLDCQIYLGAPGSTARYYADCVAWLQSEPGDLESTKNPTWRLTKVEVLRAADISELQPPGKPASDRF